MLKLEKLEETVNRRNTQIKELKNKLSRREKQINDNDLYHFVLRPTCLYPEAIQSYSLKLVVLMVRGMMFSLNFPYAHFVLRPTCLYPEAIQRIVYKCACYLLATRVKKEQQSIVFFTATERSHP